MADNALFIDSTTVLNLSSTSNTVFIDADGGTDLETDTVVISEDFTSGGTVSGNGVVYEKYMAGEATLFVTPGATVEQRSFTTLTVATTEDVLNGNTESVDALILDPGADGISLREAILATNNTRGAFSIDFEHSLAKKTITLAEGKDYGELNITDDLTISGPENSGITISAGLRSNSRIFKVDDGNAKTAKSVNLENLTITLGNASSGSIGGGGILNAEDLTLQSSTVSGNRSGLNNGGGILNQLRATLHLNNSQIVSNSAAIGGGINNAGNAGNGNETNTKVYVTDSTISNNISTLEGAGIYNDSGAFFVTNSTISGNKAGGGGGGVSTFGGVTYLYNSTVSGNTGVFGAGVLTSIGGIVLENTTVADNIILYGGKYKYQAGFEFGAGFAYLGNSIISGTKGTNAQDAVIPDGQQSIVKISGLNIVADGSFKNSKVLNVAPKLGPLANNGGPTQTHLPQTGSAAIDATTTGLFTDQRGVKRPQGSKFDIGAVEVQATSLTLLDNIVDTFDPTPRIFVSETVVSEADGEAQFTVVRTGGITQG
jgi:hypothetical protein